MVQRGLYATFLHCVGEIDKHHAYYKRFGAHDVTAALKALVDDGHFRAESTRPVKYVKTEPVNNQAIPQPSEMTRLVKECFEAYHQVRDPAWTKHKLITRTIESTLKAFIKQVGSDAPAMLRRGLEIQKREWAAGKSLSLVNLLTKDKVIHAAERAEDNTDSDGGVYRLNIPKPHIDLPDSNSYAMRVDARDNGTVQGFVFPEGQPSAGIFLSLPALAVTTKLRPWDEYQRRNV